MTTNPSAGGRHLDRRRFLGEALLAASAPLFVPRTALGRGSRAAPSHRLSIGLIGIGNMGSGHLSTMLDHPEVEVVAVCDVSRDVRERAGRKVDERYARSSDARAGCLRSNEYEELLARDDIDAVLIAVPDHWHAAITIDACRAGKDVYCEKPLSLTVREAEAMVSAARRYGRVVQTGSQQRSSANFRFACEMVRSGRIGKVRRVFVDVGPPSSAKVFTEERAPDGFDWDRWLGPAPWQPYNSERCSGSYSGGWRRVRDYSGGMTTDWGAHHFDIAQWGLGRDHDGPVRIIPPGVDGATTLTFEYDDGVVMERGGANGVRFEGTDGKVEVNRGYLRTWPESLQETPTGTGEVALYRSPGHFDDWLQCIRSRSRPIADVAIGASSVTVCHLGNIASWLGRSLAWDRQRRTIVDDPTANRWLDRPARAPYGRNRAWS
ncbi:MAG: Gfo/Idh/MocA family oxidoreductase [Planctomycetes bacterium]|nr:Gfo/Idh/MocA family oxidoreductase [Planctomycetota bacterium]